MKNAQVESTLYNKNECESNQEESNQSLTQLMIFHQR